MINSVVKVKMNSFHFEFHRIDLVVLFVLCTICMSKISERNQDNKGPFTCRKKDPSTGRSHKAEQSPLRWVYMQKLRSEWCANVEAVREGIKNGERQKQTYI